MRRSTKLMRTPGSLAVAIVVGLMFVTPVIAATTLRPLTIRWSALLDFVSAHQFELILGFSLMIAIALLLKATALTTARRSTHVRPILANRGPRGIDGLA